MGKPTGFMEYKREDAPAVVQTYELHPNIHA